MQEDSIGCGDLDDDSGPREECGVFGVYGCNGAAGLLYEGLFAQQHRGQEGAGLAVIDADGHTHYLKGLGLLNNAVDAKEAADLGGSMGIGHVRYSTTGSSRLTNVQPLIGERSEERRVGKECRSRWSPYH